MTITVLHFAKITWVNMLAGIGCLVFTDTDYALVPRY